MRLMQVLGGLLVLVGVGLLAFAIHASSLMPLAVVLTVAGAALLIVVALRSREHARS